MMPTMIISKKVPNTKNNRVSIMTHILMQQSKMKNELMLRMYLFKHTSVTSKTKYCH